jgi:septal ring factor EnvC (AmiA/AmiB activator)
MWGDKSRLKIFPLAFHPKGRENINIVWLWRMGQGVQTGGKVITELEKEMRDLQKELAEIKKDQSVLRLQPCRGDSEIREKDGKLEELDMRAKTINRTIHDLTRKRQLLISESTSRGTYDLPNSIKSS